MKKVVSILLLTLMLVVGAHPTLAMHYCDGNLYSFGLLNDDEMKSCCTEEATPPQHHSCCDEVDDNLDSHAHKFKMSHDSCCDFQKVQISTDDFQHQERQYTLNNLLPSIDELSFAFNYLLNSIESDDSTSLSHSFPPGGFSKLNVDILTYICIYRI